MNGAAGLAVTPADGAVRTIHHFKPPLEGIEVLNSFQWTGLDRLVVDQHMTNDNLRKTARKHRLGVQTHPF